MLRVPEPQSAPTRWPPRLISSIALGALTAALLSVVWFAAEALLVPHERFTGENDVEWALEIFGVSFCLWSAGLAVLGVPAWCVLHRYGYRSWYAAAILGFMLPLIVCWRGGDTISVLFGHPPKHGWEIYWTDVADGAIGIIVSLTIWAIAYHQIKRPFRTT